MVSKFFSLGCNGLDMHSVEVEVDVTRGLPSVSLGGLVNVEVKESRDRIRSAIKNSGFNFPPQRITINLAPANTKKEGTHFDLSIALGVILASGQVSFDSSEYYILGELSLEGNLRRIQGVFPMALQAKEEGKKIIIPFENGAEAALVKGLEFYPVKTLKEAVNLLSGQAFEIKDFPPLKDLSKAQTSYSIDFSDIKGQLFARRAMEVSSSGMHNIILIGPPGVGKTMLARRLPTILPDMEFEESLELTKIYSISGLLSKENPFMRTRPYRAPHHTSSSVALVGGGANIQPGEVTLAHQGVLFLDELPEFNRAALEALRQPLEDGFLQISRANKRVVFPSKFLFVAAMNPCPCGYYGSNIRNCNCSSFQIQKYRNKVSGPLLDRVDIHVELVAIGASELLSEESNPETSRDIKTRVELAGNIQKDRFKEENIFFNSQMNHKQIKRFCYLQAEVKNILEAAIKYFKFSARAYDKILKVSRTIADLAQRDKIRPEDISEAINYRSMDKKLWI